MTPLIKKILKRLRSRQRLLLAILVIGLAFAGTTYLSERAEKEGNARKSVETLALEKNPEQWLAHHKNESDLSRALDAHQLSVVGLDASEPGLVLYTLKNAEKASTRIPGCTAFSCAGTLVQRLSEQSTVAGFALVRIDIDARPASQRVLDRAMAVISPLLRLALLVGAMILAMKFQTGFGSGEAKITERPETQFDDVIGHREAKVALNRARAFLQDPAQYLKLGARAPRGVLLVGGPGTGKTMLARALAGASKSSFISVDGSYFSAMYYGAGISKVKALFKLARKHAPCVLFIDEIDGIGKRSHSGAQNGGESELNRIINRVLVEMDGFDALDNVVVVGATNHEENIDEAMLRAGRFDSLIRLQPPNMPERKQIFDHYVGKVPHDGLVDRLCVARMTAGCSPSDIMNLVNKAASSAAEAQLTQVPADYFMQAIENHQLGGEVSPLKDLYTEELRVQLANHEAGHAWVGHHMGTANIERVSIEPRGKALGVNFISRATEDPLFREPELTTRLAMLLGGREAELLVLNSLSTGARDDLKRATELAFEMIGAFGFSKEFGLLSIDGVPKAMLGPAIQEPAAREVRSMLEAAQVTCQRLLRRDRTQLAALVERLLELDVLSGEELQALLGARNPA
jgi:cell division protease FtsH